MTWKVQTKRAKAYRTVETRETLAGALAALRKRGLAGLFGRVQAPDGSCWFVDRDGRAVRRDAKPPVAGSGTARLAGTVKRRKEA